jgi:hypothetical protein
LSAPLRFLALAVVGWAALRGATLGLIPGAEMFTIGRSEAAPPPPSLVATQFPPLDPVMSEIPPQPMPLQALAAYRPIAVPVPYFVRAAASPAPAAQPQALTQIEPIAAPVFYSPIRQLEDWPLSEITGRGPAPRRSAVSGVQQSTPQVLKPRLDRLQLTAWALLRGKPGPNSLASGGTLGGSQAGARLTYYAAPWLAGSLRTSSPIGGARGGEVAAGVRVAPFRSVPVALTAERRQAIGEGAGRSAFAVFLEGGVYQKPMPWKLQLDAYAQGGVVGVRSRDLFVDGGMTLMRPLFREFAVGMGVWGGAQPGLYRVDAGPRVSMRVRGNMAVHLDWRQRMTGNAAPGSGPALTLAGDF